MCLFTNDPTSQCKHVQCNLIKTIQLQNPQIFPHLAVNGSHQKKMHQHQQRCIPQIIADHYSIDRSPMNNNNVDNSSMVQQSHINNQNNLIKQEHNQLFQLQFNHNNQQKSKQNNPLQSIYHHNTEHHNSPQHQHQQIPHLQLQSPNNNNPLLASYRINVLQKQVAILKAGMRNLIDILKQQNILSQQQYTIQQSIFKQLQNLQQLNSTKQAQNEQHSNRNHNNA